MLFFIKIKKYAFLIEEKYLNNKLFNLIKEISENRSILDRMVKIQSQYSDKNVYQNVEQILEKITHEKINLGQKEVIHFVGIGGIGMSGLAQNYEKYGIQSSGQRPK